LCSCSPTLIADNVIRFIFVSLLSYIDNEQYNYFVTCSPTLTVDDIFSLLCLCSPTLTADNVLISCLALLHWQQTLCFFHMFLFSYIDNGQCLYHLSCSLTLTTDNIFPFKFCLTLSHWQWPTSFLSIFYRQ
jgi:hypothetical protein